MRKIRKQRKYSQQNNDQIQNKARTSENPFLKAGKYTNATIIQKQNHIERIIHKTTVGKILNRTRLPLKIFALLFQLEFDIYNTIQILVQLVNQAFSSSTPKRFFRNPALNLNRLAAPSNQALSKIQYKINVKILLPEVQNREFCTNDLLHIYRRF